MYSPRRKDKTALNQNCSFFHLAYVGLCRVFRGEIRHDDVMKKIKISQVIV